MFSVYRKSSANSGCCSTKLLNLSVGRPQGGARDKTTNGLKSGTERLHLKPWPTCNSTVRKVSKDQKYLIHHQISKLAFQ